MCGRADRSTDPADPWTSSNVWTPACTNCDELLTEPAYEVEQGRSMVLCFCSEGCYDSFYDALGDDWE